MVPFKGSPTFGNSHFGESPESTITPGLLGNQGEECINFYFIMVPLRKKYSMVP